MFWEQLVNWIVEVDWLFDKQWSGKGGLPLGTEETQVNQKYLGLHRTIPKAVDMVWGPVYLPHTCCPLQPYLSITWS